MLELYRIAKMPMVTGTILAQSTNFGYGQECRKQRQGELFVGPVSSSAKARVASFWKNVSRAAALTAAIILFGNLDSSCASAEPAPNAVIDRPLLLTSAGQVHDLAPELANQARVQIVGVVTYYDPGEHNLFIQDETGAVYIETDKAYPLQYGDYVSVRGLALASYRTEVAPDP